MRTNKLFISGIVMCFSLLSFFYIYFLVEPNLIYHHQQIAFLTDWQFLKEHLVIAGGPSEYLSFFLSQFFRSNFLGSLIITLVALLNGFLLFQFIKRRYHTIRIPLLYFLLFQITAILLHSNYKFHFSIVVNTLLVIGFLNIVNTLGRKRITVLLGVAILGSILYYLSGGLYFILFVVSRLICTADSQSVLKKPGQIALILWTILFPMLAYQFLFNISFFDTYIKLKPDVAVLLLYKSTPLLYVFLSAIPGAIIWQVLAEKQTLKFPRFFAKPWVNSIKWPLQIIFAGLFIFMGIRAEFDPFEKTKTQVEFEAYNENWEQVLELSEKSEEYDRFINFNVNRALAHSNRLLDNLFQYPQILGSHALFIEQHFAGEVTLLSSDLFYELGAINESQHYALEAQTLMFYSPRVLKRLIQNCLILGQDRAAKTYLNSLENNMLEKRWVNEYRGFLKKEINGENNNWVIAKRNSIPQNDQISTAPHVKMNDLIKQNPRNKQAIEYLIAYLILEERIIETIPYLNYLGRIGYTQFPRILEEAYILNKSMAPSDPTWQQIPISKQTTQRFKEVAEIRNQYRNDKKQAQKAMQKYRDTYWYYVLFESPKVTNASLSKRIVK